MDDLRHEKTRLQTEVTAIQQKYLDIQSSYNELDASTSQAREAAHSPNRKVMQIESQYQAVLKEKKEHVSELNMVRQRLAKLEADYTEINRNKENLEYEVRLLSDILF